MKTRLTYGAAKMPPLRNWPIIFVDGYFRYVNHDLKLVSTGFSVPGALERNADIIRTDPASLNTMSKRYADMFNTDKGA